MLIVEYLDLTLANNSDGLSVLTRLVGDWGRRTLRHLSCENMCQAASFRQVVVTKDRCRPVTSGKAKLSPVQL